MARHVAHVALQGALVAHKKGIFCGLTGDVSTRGPRGPTGDPLGPSECHYDAIEWLL